MRALLLLSAFAILYGSLYPFELDLKLARMRLAPAWPSHISLSDMVANVALFVPYGFAGRLRTLIEPRGRSATFWLVVLGLALAALVQVLQAGIPSRTPSSADVAFNAVGLALGIALASVVLRLHWASAFKLSDPQALALVGLFLAYQFAPFVPTLDVGLVWANLKSFASAPLFDVYAIARNALYWLIAGILASGVLGRPPSWPLLLGLCALVLGLRLSILGNGFMPAQAAGALIGVFIYLLSARRAEQTFYVAVGALLLSLIFLQGVTPVEARPSPVMPALVPFTGILHGSWLANLVALCFKLFAYGSAVWLLSKSGWRYVAAVALVVLIAAFVEAAQILLASGFPEITDPILVILIAWLLHQLRLGERTREGHAQTKIFSSTIAR